jgi:hypothetical protein
MKTQRADLNQPAVIGETEAIEAFQGAITAWVTAELTDLGNCQENASFHS